MIEADLLIPVIGVGSDGTEVAVNFGDRGAFVIWVIIIIIILLLFFFNKCM
jgi:hypothetical protein